MTISSCVWLPAAVGSCYFQDALGIALSSSEQRMVTSPTSAFLQKVKAAKTVHASMLSGKTFSASFDFETKTVHASMSSGKTFYEKLSFDFETVSIKHVKIIFLAMMLKENIPEENMSQARGLAAAKQTIEDYPDCLQVINNGVVVGDSNIFSQGADDVEVTLVIDGNKATLHRASLHGHADVVRVLLAAGADVTTKDQTGYTALHRASENGHAKIVQVLLDAGADVTTGIWGADCDPISAKMGEIVSYDHRCDFTALRLADAKRHADVVQVLLDARPDIEEKHP